MTPTTEQLKDLLAKVTPDWRVSHIYYENGWYVSAVFAGDAEIIWFEDNYERDQDYATLIALAPTLAAEVVRLRGIIEKVDQYVPVADDTCDEPGITFTEAVMRQWPELRRQALDATSDA